jgi:hypothetical protein
MSVARKAPVQSPAETVTLSDADIASERAVTRRSLLTALGLGAGAAAGVVFSPNSAPAADAKSKKKKKPEPKKPNEETDKD